MSDERARLSKTYRDLDGADLLELYRNRADLSPLAVETLRDELKLRGVDPDSLMATVPKAEGGDDEPGDASDASLAGEEDADGDGEEVDDENAEPPPAPEVPEELRGEFESVQKAPEREAASAPGNPSTMERPRVGAAPQPAAVEPGTVASATFGLMGLSGIVFAIYVFTGDPAARSFAGIAGVIGAICLGISATLYRKSR